MNPTHRYLADASKLAPGESVTGPARVLDLKGRKGIHPLRIHTVIKLEGGHTIDQPKGTFVLWFLALEDLAASFLADNMKIDNDHYANYCFLGSQGHGDLADAGGALAGLGGIADFAHGGDDDRGEDADDGDDREQFDEREAATRVTELRPIGDAAHGVG